MSRIAVAPKGPYGLIPSEEINGSFKQNDGALGMMQILGNSKLGSLQQRAKNPTARIPEFHEAGWNIVLQTPNGIVGLWYCWMKNQLTLCFPKENEYYLNAISDDLILKMGAEERAKYADDNTGDLSLSSARKWLLGAPRSRLIELMQANDIVIPDRSIDKANIDDKIIEETLGVSNSQPVQFINLENRIDTRLFGAFWGPYLGDCRGRVWLDYSIEHQDGREFSYVQNGQLEEADYGHYYSRTIATEWCTMAGEKNPHAPTAKPKFIRPYAKKFIQLAIDIANFMGGPTAIDIEFNSKTTLIPEELEPSGFTNIQWVKGEPGKREGYEDDIVRAERPGEIVYLISHNELVPWGTLRHLQCDNQIRVKDIMKLLVF